MKQFTLHFNDGQISGSGSDMVGRFIFAGEYDTVSGMVRMLKQYLGKHSVVYIGEPDGEGSIQGTWYIGDREKGPFLLRPALARPHGDLPIQEIG